MSPSNFNSIDAIHRLIEHIQIPFLCIDAEGKIAFINQNVECLFDIHREEIVNKDFAFLYNNLEDVERIRSQLKRLVETQCNEGWQDETELVDTSGEIFPASVSFATILDAENKISFFSMLIQDLREQRKIENDYCERIEQLELIATEHNKELEEAYEEIKSRAQETEVYSRVVQEANKELLQQINELEENNRLLDLINSLSNKFRTMLNLDTIYQTVPLSVCEELGYDNAIVFSLQENQLSLESYYLKEKQEDIEINKPILINREEYPVFYNKLLETGEPLILTDNKQLTGILSNLIHSPACVAPIKNQNKIIGIIIVDNAIQQEEISENDIERLMAFNTMLGLSIDNTTLYAIVKERLEDLQKANMELKELDKLKSNFLSTATHELRTPMVTIKGYIDYMLRGSMGELNEKQKRALRVMYRSGERLIRLINDMLDLAKITTGRMQMDFKPIQLNDVAELSILTLYNLAEEKQIHIESQLDKLPLIKADADKLEQVFINIISNAIKFTPEGGEILIITRNRRERVETSISDTGIGMTEEDIESVFDEFTQFGKSKKGQEKGTGLGMAITKKIIQAHKGKISVKSKLNEGTTFTFFLPLNPIAE